MSLSTHPTLTHTIDRDTLTNHRPQGYGQVHLIIVWGDAMDVSAGTKEDMKSANLDNFMEFVYVGLFCGAAAWVYTSLFKITGYRQGAYWRKYYLESVLRQVRATHKSRERAGLGQARERVLGQRWVIIQPSLRSGTTSSRICRVSA